LANNFFNKTHQEQTTVGRGKMEVLQSEIVEPLRELLVNKLEFELLRLISFFSTGHFLFVQLSVIIKTDFFPTPFQCLNLAKTANDLFSSSRANMFAR
jgi:hypothetical protein